MEKSKFIYLNKVTISLFAYVIIQLFLLEILPHVHYFTMSFVFGRIEHRFQVRYTHVDVFCN